MSVLRDVVDSGMPVAIFETQQRDLSHRIRFMMSPVMVLLINPFIRPFRFSRLFWTYFVPLLPLLRLLRLLHLLHLVVGWDGAVSVLRTYSRDEMVSMANEADSGSQFQWSCDTVAFGASRMPFLIGRPRC